MTNVIEIWKPCYNYENYFEVSNIGRIRKKGTQKILQPSKCKKGYLNIRLFVTKENFKSHKVHRLVMNTFSEIKNQPQVNHMNGVKDDNRLENLEWSDNSKNIKHAWATGLFKPKAIKSTENHFAKIYLHKEYGTFKTLIEAAKEFNVSRHTIHKNKLFNLKYTRV